MPPVVSAASTVVLFAVPVVAQLPDPKSSESVGWLILTGAALLVIIKNGSDLFRSWFVKNPPDHDRYASKDELAKVEKQVTEAKAEIRAEAAKETKRVEERFEEWLADIDKKLDKHAKDSHDSREQTERALGRIEGKIDGLKGK